MSRVRGRTSVEIWNSEDNRGAPWRLSCLIAGVRGTISGVCGVTSRVAESARSRFGTGEPAKMKCACTGRRVRRCSASATTGTCSPKHRRRGQPAPGYRRSRVHRSTLRWRWGGYITWPAEPDATHAGSAESHRILAHVTGRAANACRIERSSLSVISSSSEGMALYGGATITVSPATPSTLPPIG
jgi:hypothetical protein